MTTTVRKILAQKGSTLFTMDPERSVFEALELMSKEGVGSVLVTRGDKLLGIFTERDYARKIALQGRRSRESRLEDLMTRELLTVHPNDTLEHCMAIITTKHFRHLPVVEDGKLLGIVTIGDVLKAVIETQASAIEELNRYISGAS
ncbi:MAG: CBS domain-containing protein [Spirochaetes bacterium]|nr:CBS domain-containing protein [Spirochaetota bacterium]